MSDPVRLRSRSGTAIAVVAVAACLVGVVLALIEMPLPQAARFLPPLLLIGALGVVLFGRPVLELGAEGATVRNPFSTVEVPWGRVTLIGVRDGLILETSAGSVAVWAVPKALRVEGPDGVTAADLVRARVEAAAPDGGAGPLRRRAHALEIAVLAVLAAAAAVGLLA